MLDQRTSLATMMFRSSRASISASAIVETALLALLVLLVFEIGLEGEGSHRSPLRVIYTVLTNCWSVGTVLCCSHCGEEVKEEGFDEHF